MPTWRREAWIWCGMEGERRPEGEMADGEVVGRDERDGMLGVRKVVIEGWRGEMKRRRLVVVVGGDIVGDEVEVWLGEVEVWLGEVEVWLGEVGCASLLGAVVGDCAVGVAFSIQTSLMTPKGFPNGS